MSKGFKITVMILLAAFVLFLAFLSSKYCPDSLYCESKCICKSIQNEYDPSWFGMPTYRCEPLYKFW